MVPNSGTGSSPDGTVEDYTARLGQKLSILYRLHGDPDHPFSEVVGLLQRVTAGAGDARTLTVCRRDGSTVDVGVGDIVRLKWVPIRGSTPWGHGASGTPLA